MFRYIKSSQQNNGWWYLFRHGLGPGTIPRDVTVLEVVDHPTNRYKCYALLDRVLTTQELQEYDLKEESPEIEGSTSILAEKDTPYDPDIAMRKRYSRLQRPLKVGDIVKIEKSVHGGKTPNWAEGRTAEVIRINSPYSVTVIIDDYRKTKTQINPYDTYIISGGVAMKRMINASYSAYDIEKALNAGKDPDEYYTEYHGPTSEDLDNGAITVDSAEIGDVIELGFDTSKLPHGLEAKIVGKRPTGKTIQITYEVVDYPGSVLHSPYHLHDQEVCNYYPGEFIGYLV